VSDRSPPFVIVQGEKDTIVAPQQSIDFNDALKKAGVDTQLRIIPGRDMAATMAPPSTSTLLS